MYLSKTERARMTNDGWANVLTGMGTDRDKTTSAVFSRRRLSEAMLNDLYHGDDIFKRACDIVPEEMTREWIDLPTDSDGKLNAELERLGARQAFTDAMVWERQSGGGAIYLDVEDGRELNEALDPKAVTKVNSLVVYDRFELKAVDWYDDPYSAKYGEPLYYTINLRGQATGRVPDPTRKVHESRFIVFNGGRTKRVLRPQYDGWGVPIIEIIFDIVRDFTTSYRHAAIIVQDFAQAVYQIENLSAMLAADKDGLVLKRLRLLELTRSTMRAVVLDAEKEKFARQGTPVSGLEEILDRLGLRLATALNVPIALLLGQSPGGLNATGESDHRNFYNVIHAQQETRLRPPLARLIDILVSSKYVRVPKNLKDDSGAVPFTFCSLWQPTDLEIAQAHEHQAKADDLYVANGTLSPDDVRKARFSGGYSYSTGVTGKAPGPPTPPAVGGATGAPVAVPR